MIGAILHRAAVCAVTLLAASLVIFTVLDLLPGNAAAVLLGTAARPDTLAALSHQLGLDRPAPLRYATWIVGLATGDLGQSATYGVPVGGLIAERLAVTLPLALLAFGLAAGLGIVGGAAAAAAPRQLPDRAATAFAQVGLAIPDFWMGLLLILVFSTLLRWFAAGGFPGWGDPLAAMRALVLPAIALAVPQAAVLTRVTRAAVLETAGQDFVRTAWAKGSSAGHVLWRHRLPNAIGPVLAIAGLQASFLMAGAVLVENVFDLPGLGRLAFQALAQRDLVVIRSVMLLLAGFVLLANALVDMVALWLDPRLRAP